MAHVIFYGKPGCGGNERQLELLRAAGHEVEVRDLLTHPWTVEALLPFLAGAPVPEWFNRTAPRVKSGEVAPERLQAAEALALLLAEPGLIRRPLLQVGSRREVGFLAAVVGEWIGLEPLEPADGGAAGCGGGRCGPDADAPIQLGRR